MNLIGNIWFCNFCEGNRVAGEVRWCGAAAPARRKGVAGVRQKTARRPDALRVRAASRDWAAFGPLATSMQVEAKRGFGPTSTKIL